MDGLSDEAVCARDLASPSGHLFCGATQFQPARPPNRSCLTRGRRRSGAERLEPLPAESLAAAQRGGAGQATHLRRVSIDPTVPPTAGTHPTDSELPHRGLDILARLARRHRVAPRQSDVRVAKWAGREAARLMHSGRPRQAERPVRRLRTWRGRLARDIPRQSAGEEGAQARVRQTPGLVTHLVRQRREERGSGTLHSLRAPAVACLGTGKARARVESGVKGSLAATNAAAPGGRFGGGARASPGTP